jgi:hypothetical protein
MDYQLAEDQVRKYVQAVRDCASMQVLSKERRKALSDLNLRLPNINRILVTRLSQFLIVGVWHRDSFQLTRSTGAGAEAGRKGQRS